MSRIIFLNRYFYPDQSATSRILSDLAFHLASIGMEIAVVTSRQRYQDAAADLSPFEYIKGVEIHRVKTSGFGRVGVLGRSIDYASFYFSARTKLMAITNPGDILVAKTDPPLLSILGSSLQRSNKIILVNWLQDLYPEVAHELGIPFLRGPVYSALLALRNRSLQAAAMNVVVGDKMAARIEMVGVDRDRIRMIPNWTNEDEITPIPSSANPLVSQWGIEGKFVVGYSGNLGRAHDFETLLSAAEILKADPSIVFLNIGGGSGMSRLEKRAQELGLSASFRFLPYQDEGLLRYSLGVFDAQWLSLLPALEGLIVPSKFYGIIAAGKPVVFIGHPDGEIAAIVERERIGYAVPAGDGAALARRISQLKEDPALRATLAASARVASETIFSRTNSLAAWTRLLESLSVSID